MSGVEVEDVGGFGVEDKPDGPEILLLLLPHLPGYVVTVAKVVAETLALAV